jgi:hypothetical protein
MVKKTFPTLGNNSDETVHSYIDEAKSSSELLREFVKVLASFLVGGLVSLYCDH